MTSKELLRAIILFHVTKNEEKTFQVTVQTLRLAIRGFGRQEVGVRQIRRLLKHAEEKGLIKRTRHDQENGKLGTQAQATSYEIPDLRKTLRAAIGPIPVIISLLTNTPKAGTWSRNPSPLDPPLGERVAREEKRKSCHEARRRPVPGGDFGNRGRVELR